MNFEVKNTTMNIQPQVIDYELSDNVKVSKVLLLNIYKSSENTISSSTLFNLFSQYGEVQKILIFEKLAMQKAFIEFKNMEAAIQAKVMLDNQMVNNALIKIYFSKQQQLRIKKSGQNAIDYTQTDLEFIDQNKNLQCSIQNSVESTSCSDDSLSQNAQQQFISELPNDTFYPQTLQQNLKFQNQNQQMMMTDDTTNILNMNLNQNFLSYTNNESLNIKQGTNKSRFSNNFINNNSNTVVQPEASFTDELISQLNNMKNSQTQSTNYTLFGTGGSTTSSKSVSNERSREMSFGSSGDESSPMKQKTTIPIKNFSLQQQQTFFPEQQQQQQQTQLIDDNLFFNKFQQMNLNDNSIQQQNSLFQQQNLFNNQIDFDLDQLTLLQQQSQLQQQQQSSNIIPQDFKSSVLVIKNLEQQQQLNAKLIFLIFSNFGNIRLLQYLLRKQEILLEFENQQQACCAKNFVANYEIDGCKISIEFYHQQNIPSKIQTYDEIFIYGNQKEFRFDGKTDLNKLNPPSATIHVSNISPAAYDISVLYNIFQQYGKIENIKLYQKNNRNMSFIKFQTVKDSFNAMGLHGEEYFGRKFHISFTRMKI